MNYVFLQCNYAFHQENWRTLYHPQEGNNRKFGTFKKKRCACFSAAIEEVKDLLPAIAGDWNEMIFKVPFILTHDYRLWLDRPWYRLWFYNRNRSVLLFGFFLIIFTLFKMREHSKKLQLLKLHIHTHTYACFYFSVNTQAQEFTNLVKEL